MTARVPRVPLTGAANRSGTRVYVTSFEPIAPGRSFGNSGLHVLDVDFFAGSALADGTEPRQREIFAKYLGNFGPTGKGFDVKLMPPADPAGEAGDWIFMTNVGLPQPDHAPGPQCLPNPNSFRTVTAMPEPIVLRNPDGVFASQFHVTGDPAIPADRLVVGQGPGGTAVMRVVNPVGSGDGAQVEPTLNTSGEVRVATGDVNGDGEVELLVTIGNSVDDGQGTQVARVSVQGQDGVELERFRAASGAEAAKGVSVAAGDVDDDGVAEIVTADREPTFDAGGTPFYLVKIWDFDGAAPEGQRVTFKAQFAGAGGLTLDDGLDLGIGNLDADAADEVIVGYRGDFDLSGTPATKVCVFDDDAAPGTWAEKFAFVPFTGSGADRGVTVAGGDVDGDGEDEIVLGQRGSQLLDMDGDGTPETPGSLVCVWDRSNGWTDWVKKIVPFLDADAVGVDVALGNFDGDKDPELEIATAQEEAAGSKSLVRLFDEDGAFGTQITFFFAFGPADLQTAGVNLASIR